ncbi:sensor histidine kinase [Frankia sp. CcWB2]
MSRRPETVIRRGTNEDYRAYVHEQASLTARLEETDRLRRDLVDTVAYEFRAPLAGIRAVLTDARSGEAEGGTLAGRLDTAIDSTRQLERLLESMVTATTAAHTDINASDLTAALADVQTVLHTTHTGCLVVVDAPAYLPVRMDGATLRRLLGDLVDTVLRSTPAGAPVHIGAGQVGTDLIILRIRTPTRVLPDDTEASALAAPSERESATSSSRSSPPTAAGCVPTPSTTMASSTSSRSSFPPPASLRSHRSARPQPFTVLAIRPRPPRPRRQPERESTDRCRVFSAPC